MGKTKKRRAKNVSTRDLRGLLTRSLSEKLEMRSQKFNIIDIYHCHVLKPLWPSVIKIRKYGSVMT
jgi:hypothetical protein